jgi:NAD(P)-dependent dehydrogenase (short-subunit alcohol dehydrogenase family)
LSVNARIAVVTGASRGIGAATALRLATLDWDVRVSFRERDVEVAGDVPKRITVDSSVSRLRT